MTFELRPVYGVPLYNLKIMLPGVPFQNIFHLYSIITKLESFKAGTNLTTIIHIGTINGGIFRSINA